MFFFCHLPSVTGGVCDILSVLRKRSVG